MQCKKCGIDKSESEFYANDKTCKSCRKALVKANREAKSDYYREYDRARANNPDRVEARKNYASTERGRQVSVRARKAYSERYPMRRAAYVITGNEIRAGRLIKPEYCESCGGSHKIEAHHDDYTKPLDVRWMCEICHKQWHRNNKAIYQ